MVELVLSRERDAHSSHDEEDTFLLYFKCEAKKFLECSRIRIKLNSLNSNLVRERFSQKKEVYEIEFGLLSLRFFQQLITNIYHLRLFSHRTTTSISKKIAIRN